MTAPISADLAGKHCVVTGASAGIGKELARELSRLGATVTLACRDLAKARAVKIELEHQNPRAQLELEQVDVSEARSIASFVERVELKHPKLDVLVNNAGGWTMDRRTTSDGLELQWATNVLGPHLLTRALAPVLAGGGRVVNVASTAAGGLDLNDSQFEQRGYSGVGAYSATKQALRMLSWSWAERLNASGVSVNAMSPGLVNTELNRNAQGFFAFAFTLTKLFAKTPEKGADTALWLAASPELAGVSNQFWDNRKSIACKFRNAAEQERLFALCEAQTEARLARRNAA